MVFLHLGMRSLHGSRCCGEDVFDGFITEVHDSRFFGSCSAWCWSALRSRPAWLTPSCCFRPRYQYIKRRLHKSTHLHFGSSGREIGVPKLGVELHPNWVMLQGVPKVPATSLQRQFQVLTLFGSLQIWVDWQLPLLAFRVDWSARATHHPVIRQAQLAQKKPSTI